MQPLRIMSARGARFAARLRRLAPLATIAAAVLSFSTTASAQITVTTLGGGRLVANGPDYGNADGNTASAAQFNSPRGTAMDSHGNLFLADFGNSAIRKITSPGDIANSQTSTYLSGIAGPVGVVIDPSDNLWILTTNSNLIEYNKFKNKIRTVSLGFTGGSALTLATNGNIYVCSSTGMIVEYSASGVLRTVLNNGGTLRGIGMLPNGRLVVSINTNAWFKNAIASCPTTNVNVSAPFSLIAGNNGMGFADGAFAFAKFNAPWGLSVSSDGRIAVADRYNERVRLIDTASNTVTLYGIPPSQWNQSYYPGWADGGQNVAAAHDPLTVFIATNGVVYTTEVFYHLLRQVTGSGLSTAYTNSVVVTTNGGTTNVVITAPAFTPNCGYFPQLQTITITNSVTNVYYTVDGSDPTTNSFRVPDSGSFTWAFPTNSLTSLKMKAFVGTNSSATVTGFACGDNEIGFTKDMVAGVGSTVVIPIVMTMQSNGVAKSLQFRAEIAPLVGSPDRPVSMELLPVTTNDFVQVVGPGSGTVSFQTYAYTNTVLSNGLGVVVSALGSGSGFDVKNFAVVALLKVQIPTTCTQGQSYELDILYPSGTSDGVQAAININSMPSRQLTVSNLQFMVGDSSLGRWYNAGDFGDGTLANADVNNVLYASAGIRKPYVFSDVYNAMDAYPPDLGGDGQIRFLDVQTIWFRSLGLDQNNYFRFWNGGDQPDQTSVFTNAAPHMVSRIVAATPGKVWLRQASVGAGTANYLLPGQVCSLPVYVNVRPGFSLSGLEFRATVNGVDNAPQPGAITFTPAPAIGGTQVLPGQSPNDIVCAWYLGSFSPQLQGSNYLGTISFTVPGLATKGNSYALKFSYVDGAPDINTQYDLESFPGCAWVQIGATNPPSLTSDEWKTQFFGSISNALASDNIDSDGDGVPNWKEFIAGTNPTNALSCLQFSSATSASGVTTLSWLTAPAKTYLIEAAANITSTNWTVVGTLVGDGTVHSVNETNSANAQFYRIEVQ